MRANNDGREGVAVWARASTRRRTRAPDPQVGSLATGRGPADSSRSCCGRAPSTSVHSVAAPCTARRSSGPLTPNSIGTSTIRTRAPRPPNSPASTRRAAPMRRFVRASPSSTIATSRSRQVIRSRSGDGPCSSTRAPVALVVFPMRPFPAPRAAERDGEHAPTRALRRGGEGKSRLFGFDHQERRRHVAEQRAALGREIQMRPIEAAQVFGFRLCRPRFLDCRGAHGSRPRARSPATRADRQCRPGRHDAAAGRAARVLRGPSHVARRRAQQLGVDAECGVPIEVVRRRGSSRAGRFASRRAIQAETSRSLQR